jgi:hypothetical protein
MGTPSAQTLVEFASEKYRELEEVPLMTIVGGSDVHRKQITFDYVDDDGVVHWGEIRPHARRCGVGWASTARAGTRSLRWRAAPGGDMWSMSWPWRGWWRMMIQRLEHCMVRGGSIPLRWGPGRRACAVWAYRVSALEICHRRSALSRSSTYGATPAVWSARSLICRASAQSS